MGRRVRRPYTLPPEQRIPLLAEPIQPDATAADLFQRNQAAIRAWHAAREAAGVPPRTENQIKE